MTVVVAVGPSRTAITVTWRVRAERSPAAADVRRGGPGRARRARRPGAGEAARGGRGGPGRARRPGAGEAARGGRGGPGRARRPGAGQATGVIVPSVATTNRPPPA